MNTKAYLEITMVIETKNRPAAAQVYADYRQPFLDQIDGARSKDLLIREEDVQVLHGFDSVEAARAYLSSPLFQEDVFVQLKPLWAKDPRRKNLQRCISRRDPNRAGQGEIIPIRPGIH